VSAGAVYHCHRCGWQCVIERWETVSDVVRAHHRLHSAADHGDSAARTMIGRLAAAQTRARRIESRRRQLRLWEE
jgi:hypothetical protein